jgi:hypothetical protein
LKGPDNELGAGRLLFLKTSSLDAAQGKERRLGSRKKPRTNEKENQECEQKYRRRIVQKNLHPEAVSTGRSDLLGAGPKNKSPDARPYPEIF